MKRLGVYTGSRANYSSTKSILLSCLKSETIKTVNVVGGAASVKRFGEIQSQMLSDGLPNVDFQYTSLSLSDDETTMSNSLADGMHKLSNFLTKKNVDAVLVVGDRYDILAPVLCASLNNVPIFHTMGGEVTGTIDENIRHAVTKMSNFHFVANDDAYNRVLRLGESEANVFNVGCPRMDTILKVVNSSFSQNINEILKKYHGVGCSKPLSNNDYILCLYHPVTTEFASQRANTNSLLSFLQREKKRVIMLWPNFDTGGDSIAKEIRTFRENNETNNWLSVYTNFSVEDYAIIQKNCGLMLGNSSSFVREGGYFGKYAVLVGSRQNKRLHGKHVVSIDEKCLDDGFDLSPFYSKNAPKSMLYGDGSAAENIIKILENNTWPEHSQKTICY